MAALTRAEAIAQIAGILALTGSYQTVYNGVPDVLDGNVVAMVYGQGYDLRQFARDEDDFDFPMTLAVVIAVAYTRADPSAAEAQIADLVLEAMRALHSAKFLRIRSDAGAGVPQRTIDGQPYRVERITCALEEDNDGD